MGPVIARRANLRKDAKNTGKEEEEEEECSKGRQKMPRP
jgi:hypothetical protein